MNERNILDIDYYLVQVILKFYNKGSFFIISTVNQINQKKRLYNFLNKL